jgi:hypothetical protein
MKVIFSLFISLGVFLSSCSSPGKPTRGVSSAEQGGLDLWSESRAIIDLVSTREINANTCEKELNTFITISAKFRFRSFKS